MIYLATPYSHKSAEVESERFNAAALAVGILLHRGRLVLSPICHSHPVKEACSMPGDWKTWQAHSLALLDLCSEVYVVMMPGWLMSLGVTAECVHAIKTGKPISYLTWPELLPADKTQ